MHPSADFVVAEIGSVTFLSALTPRAKNANFLSDVHRAVKVDSGFLIETSNLNEAIDAVTNRGMVVTKPSG